MNEFIEKIKYIESLFGDLDERIVIGLNRHIAILRSRITPS